MERVEDTPCRLFMLSLVLDVLGISFILKASVASPVKWV